MTHQLREAFRDLAESADHVQASTGAPAGTHDLWRRGRRARRRRVASSVLVAGAVLALLGAVLPVVGGQLRTTPAPASYDETDLAAPDRIWAPSSWASTVGPEDPPGPLAAVALAPRLRPWLVTTTDRWFGVSAVDQQPRWLDLPGQATSEEAQAISLSPDGTRLAYALGGDPSAPNPQSDVVGFAVMDLVSGEVRERRIETRFGLRSEHLVWSGDSQWLVTAAAQYRRMRGSSNFAEFEAWSPETDEVTVIPGLDDWSDMGTAPRGVATWSEEGGPLLEVDPATGEVVPRRIDWWWEDDAASDAPAFNPDRSLVVWRDGWRFQKGPLRGGTFPALYAASLSPDGDPGRPSRVKTPGWMLGAVLGWLAPGTVLVEGSREARGMVSEAPSQIMAVDVRTGEVTPAISRPKTWDELHETQLARDLLVRPLGHAEEPFWPLPLWLTALLAGPVLVLVAVAVRRRRAPQELPVSADGSAG